jgi:cbb3-type cytochrome oxidase maturation protein
MSVMFILLPVALLFAATALAVFLWAVHAGQFDDLDTPPLRVLAEDDEPSGAGEIRREASRAGSRDAG